MSENIVNHWLSSFAASAVDANLDVHMSHIAKTVQVYGVPGFESVSYDDWYRQCAQEFPQKLIKELNYSDISFTHTDDNKIVIKAKEQLLTNEGKNQTNDLEMVLEQIDEVWLLTVMTILEQPQSVSITDLM